MELVVTQRKLPRECVHLQLKAKDIRAAFAKFDSDRSGSLDYAEFRKGLLSLGIVLSDEEFVALIDVLDNNRDGDIDYDEFLEDLRVLHPEQAAEEEAAKRHREALESVSKSDAADAEPAPDGDAPPVADAEGDGADAEHEGGDEDEEGKEGGSVLRQVAEAVEAWSATWLDPSRTVAELDREGGRVYLEMTTTKPPPPRNPDPPKKKPKAPPAKKAKGKGKGKDKGKEKGKAMSKKEKEALKEKQRLAALAARKAEVRAAIAQHRAARAELNEEARRKARGAATAARQAAATIDIEVDPLTGRVAQMQVPITPLPLLIARGEMDREQLMHEMIDGMDEEEALALCEELGEELPEQSLEVAQIALRMHYSQNQGQGLHVTPEGTVPLANFLMGDGQVRAYAEGLRRLGAQGVVIRRLELANNALTDQGLVPLARALKCCSRLEHLDLSSNRIRREGCDALGRYLVDPNDEDGGCAISTLLMSKNNMGEAAARSVLKAMRDQVTVTELDLSSNKVGGGGVGQSLAELLEDNTTLQVRPPPAFPLDMF